MEWRYNPAGSPLPADQVIQAMTKASKHWEAVCNVSFRYIGTTTADPDNQDGQNVLGWKTFTGGLAPFSAYAAARSAGSVIVEGDVVLNRSVGLPPAELEGLLTHEIGHILGIQHSDDPASIMYDKPYHNFRYQATPRGDDVRACASLYGYSPKAHVERIFNWAEWTFPYFKPEVQISQNLNGYHFRYYPSSVTYMGEKDGDLYVLGNNNILYPTITKVGTVTDYYNKALSSGF